jgi:hypothetical protein
VCGASDEGVLVQEQEPYASRFVHREARAQGETAGGVGGCAFVRTDSA